MRYLGVELHSDEEVKGVVRQFTARLLAPFTACGILIFGTFYFFVPLWNLRIWRWDASVAGRAIVVLLIFLGIYYALRSYVKWHGTFLLITDQRIVDVDRRGLFDRIVSEVPYQSLSSVSYRSKGFIEMSAGIGTITFQVYSGNEDVSFKYIMHPAALHKQILELRVAHLRGDSVSNDPVEGILGRVGKLSPTEQRALLTGLKKSVPAKKMVKRPEETELP